jgi:lipopolysaccharide heptosyltransferase I
MRVLLVRLGALGDLVHALPVAAAIKAAWPGARLDWLAESRHRPFLDLVPVLDDRIAIDTRSVRGRCGWPAVVRDMRSRRYEAALDVQGLLKSAVLARLSGARRVIGFARAHLREPLAVHAYGETVDPRAAVHVVEKNLACAAALGVPVAAPRFPLSTPPPSPEVAAVMDAAGPAFAAVNPGAAWPNKRWPAERFGALARRLADRGGPRSIVLWGPGERSLADAVAAAAGGAARLAPPTSLGDLLALLARAAIVVAGDTGPLHLAAALGTPVVGIYGPTDPRRNGPWDPLDRVVSRRAVCSCYHKRRCHAPRWCLGDVTVDEVLESVEARLAEGRPFGGGVPGA